MAKEPRSLRGKVVAITGGARGIGKATAQALAAEGARVAIGDLDADLAEQTASGLGTEGIGIELDVTKRESFADYLAQVEERLGPVDVIINNAGIMPLGDFVDEDDATAHRMVDINIHGVLYGMKLALPGMLRRNTGHIVNIASQAGKAGFPGGATYCATKHAVVGLSEAVRAEVRGTAIEVSCVMPAVVNTELGSGLVESRGVKVSQPEDVATEIVRALQHPKFDVYVPRGTGVIYQFTAAMPRRAREGFARALKADQVLANADPNKRADYEARAARSEPGLEPEAASEEDAIESQPS